MLPRVSLVVDDQPVSQALVKAIWTDDTQLSTRINREVAHYTGQAELAGVIQEGLEARKGRRRRDGNHETGPGRPAGCRERQRRHRQAPLQVVDVEDAATGTVRLRRRSRTSTRWPWTRGRPRRCVSRSRSRHDGHLSERPSVGDGRLLRPTCGARIEAAPPAAASEPAPAPETPAAQGCPVCGAPEPATIGSARDAAYDFTAGTTPATWQLVVTADREYYDRLQPAGVEFPTHCPPRTFSLTGE